MSSVLENHLIWIFTRFSHNFDCELEGRRKSYFSSEKLLIKKKETSFSLGNFFRLIVIQGWNLKGVESNSLYKRRSSITQKVGIWKTFFCLQEFELLYYNLSSARIFFRLEDDDNNSDEDDEDSKSSITTASSKWIVIE